MYTSLRALNDGADVGLADLALLSCRFLPSLLWTRDERGDTARGESLAFKAAL